MKGIQVASYVKSVSELKITDLPTPEPLDTEYLVSIRASATNFFDILQVAGKYQHQPPFPWIAGSEFAGVIIKTPSGIPNPKYAVGTKVFGAAQGGYAETIAAPEASLLPVPEGWSFEDAAGLYVTAPTSYGALVVRAKVQPGEWVLIHAAAGGVSLAAIQIAKALGAKVIATAGSERKLAVAREFGADYAVDYKSANWVEEVAKICKENGRPGVDVVYDPVGLLNQSLKVVAWNCRLLVVGFAGGKIENIAANRILLKNVSVVGIHWGMYSKFESQTVPVVWEGLFQLIREGKFRGTVFKDKEFVGLESVPEALRALGARETWGKVVVRVPEPAASKL